MTGYEPPSSVHVQLTQVEVSALPPDDINRPHYTISVEWRGNDRWAVMHHGYALGTDGEWEYEPRPSSREDGWLDTHRFDYWMALRLACEQAPRVVVNGRAAAELVAVQKRGES